MLSKNDNELLTRVGPGTQMGNLMRQYWLPALMSSDLPAPDCPPARLRLLAENLIAFRTTAGKVGVIADACPHRGASMFFGRNEEEGLRCVYHGWKFDVAGNCLDMPSEPPESNFREKVHATAYAARERGGLVWLYMGSRETPPPLPSIESNMLPEGRYSLRRYLSDCNWMQSLEGDWDTVHLGFLHRGHVTLDGIPRGSLDYYTLNVKWGRMVVADTEFGATYGLNRPAEADTTYWRLAHFLFPFYAMIPTVPLGSRKMVIAVVPVDDEHCIRWNMNEVAPQEAFGGGAAGATTTGQPVVQQIFGADTFLPDTSDWLGRARPRGNRSNDYLIDRDDQATMRSYTGIPGPGQDPAVTESMGQIYDRSHEHLGVTDSGVIRMRRLLLGAARSLHDKGAPPPGIDALDVYKVRSGGIVLPNGVAGIDATKELQWRALSEEPPKLEART